MWKEFYKIHNIFTLEKLVRSGCSLSKMDFTSPWKSCLTLTYYICCAVFEQSRYESVSLIDFLLTLFHLLLQVSCAMKPLNQKNTRTHYKYKRLGVVKRFLTTNPRASVLSWKIWLFCFSLYLCGAKVDGGWSGWSGWSGCAPGICAGNQRIRTRTCTEPLPSDDGKYCDEGDSSEQKDCMSEYG